MSPYESRVLPVTTKAVPKLIPLFVSLCLLCVFVLGSKAMAQSSNLLPSYSFEQGQSRPDGWDVSLTRTPARWEPFGHEGQRSISVTGDGENEGWWQADLSLRPAQLYHTSFWVKRTAGAGGGGTVVSGPNVVNRDFPAGPDWEERAFFFRTPAKMAGVFYRLGQWHFAGAVAFDQAWLAPAVAVYSRPEGFDLPLGDGESVIAGHYRAEHRMSGPGANDHRALGTFTARFNSNRWVFEPGAYVTYSHEVGRLDQAAQTVELTVNYFVKGQLAVEGSSDGEKWTLLGAADKLGRFAFKVPFAGQSRVWIRLRASADCDLQVDAYRYECNLPSAWRVARAVGATHYFDVRHATPGLEATVSGGGLCGIGDNRLDLTLQSVYQRRTVQAALSFLQGGKEVAHDRVPVVLKPARTVPVSLKFRTLAAGPGLLRVTCSDPESHRVLWEAEAACSVPLLYDASGGQLLSESDRLSVWWCEPEWKVSRGRPAPTQRGDALRIQAAGNEYEAAQLVLTPRAVLKQCRLTPGNLLGPGGALLPASEIEVRLVDYVYTDPPTDEWGAADEWPDPLPPLPAPLDLPRGRNQPFWVTVHVPAGTPPGEYTGALTLTAEGVSQPIPLHLQVWGFDLPAQTHLRTGFGLDRGVIRQYHRPRNEAEMGRIWDLYLRDFARHRVSPYSFGRGIDVTWANSPSGDVEPRLDFTGFDEDAHHALDELGFNGFRLDLEGLGGGTFYARYPGEISGRKQGTPEYEAAFGKYVKAIQDHLEQKGWLKKAYVYWFDEPSENDTEFVKGGMQLIGRAGPKLTRLLTTAPRPALFGAVDLWCQPTYTLDPEMVKQRKAAGEELWWYLCTGPKAPYFTLFLDHYGTELRLWSWETWKYGLDGLLVWDTTYWTSSTAYPEPTLQNPWEDPMSWTSGYGTPRLSKQPWGNGDGRFLYPPNRKPIEDKRTFLDGPVPSIRWELLRDGIEDYEYFYLLRSEIARLKQAGADPKAYQEAEKLLEVPPDVCTGLTQFATTPEPIHAHRAKLAAAIEKLRLLYKKS